MKTEGKSEHLKCSKRRKRKQTKLGVLKKREIENSASKSNITICTKYAWFKYYYHKVVYLMK